MSLRRAAVVAVLLGMALPVASVAPVGASGGGGCGEPVANEAGSEVAIDGFCFTPTVLYAQPGDTVTWTNADPTFHNVVGANAAWGSFERVRQDKVVHYSFSEPGVYSYVCTMHPGMVGTVVVGDPGPGETMGAKAVRRIKTLSATQPELPAPVESSDGTALVLLGATAALAAIGVVMVARRVRRRARA